MRGAYAWAGVAGVILALDLLAPEGETLTAVCHRALARHPGPVIALVAATSAHLLLGSHPGYRRVDAFRAIEAARRTVREPWIPIPALPLAHRATNTPTLGSSTRKSLK